MIALFLFFTINYGAISIDDIQSFTPSNYFLAAAIVILIYGIKSISMFVSLTILYVSVGIIFPGSLAILINFIGLIVCMSIPYFIGRYSGSPLVEKVMSKYPKVGKLKEMKKDNEWFFVFIVKILGFIPNEISSLTLGALNIKYQTYIVASVLAKTPSMIAKTLLASNIDKAGTPEFTLYIIIGLVVFVAIAIVYWKNKDRFK